ncbi:MAG: G5 domain-containing protein, partial [Anaerolineae bacterium]
AGPTVADAIRGAGIPLDEADGLFPPGNAPLQSGMRIVIRRATPFFIEADGHRREVRALAETVGQALNALGITLSGRDYTLPPTSEALTPELTIRVVRVLEDVLVRQVPIPYRTETVAAPELPLDETRVDRPGVPGQKTQRIRIVYENGDEIFREVVEETVDREPVTEVLAYGTTIVWRTVETPEGRQRYWRKMRVYATSYSASRSGTPVTAPWYGRTRLGWTMRMGIVAVDPRYIPMQSRLFVDGYGIGVAGDTGGGIKRYHIDLGYDDDNYQGWHWPVDLYLLEPLPPERDMIWYLP